MANEQELREIKESLSKLDEQIKQINDRAGHRRSGLVNFAIAFTIIFVIILISMGALGFFNLK